MLVFAVGAGAVYAIAGKALKPITKLCRDIEAVDENNLFVPVGETASGDEVAKLSASFNRMIGKLEKAFVSQKNFSANAAHELKTPLAAMISRIEVCRLDEKPSPREYGKTLDDILQNAERLSALVGDLLEMNTEPFIERPEDINVKMMFGQIIDDISKNNPKNVRFDNRAGEIHLSGDKRLLYRAFLNIAANAVKYNRPDGMVTISAQGNGGNAVISVSDTGIGIPADQLDRIFEPFYCVDRSRSRRLGGSGLGLSLAEAIIKKHGGGIRAESEAGAFTTVTVTLPQ
jgi:signal transduction histidine kinase